jgi:hypothetical protein
MRSDKVLGSARLAPGASAPGRRAQARSSDRLAERVGRSLQPFTDLGQLSRCQVDPLLLNLGTLLLAVGTFLALTLEIVDVSGEIRELGCDDRDVVSSRQLNDEITGCFGGKKGRPCRPDGRPFRCLGPALT